MHCEALMMMRFALKAATDDIHQELDDALSQLDLARLSDYRRFLEFQARTVPAIEWKLAALGIDDLLEGWSEARRGPALVADLKALGEAMPSTLPAPVIDGTAQTLGAAYVLEGSRLGSRVLRQRVADGLPVRFLNGGETITPWLSLLSAIERLLHSETLLEDAKVAARRTFAWFLSGAREAGIR